MPILADILCKDMIKIGNYNELEVVKKVDFGFYLDGEEYGEILMPQKYAPEELKIGDMQRVFIYRDSGGRLVATTERPFLEVGEVGLLRAKSVGTVGAFMDWGVLKDLLVPFREQAVDIEEGRDYIVYVYLDNETKRIVGSTKLNKYIGNKAPRCEEGDEVEIVVVKRTDLGFKVVVDNLFWGMVYNNDVFDPIRVGDRLSAYVKHVREDGKIDVTLRGRGGDRVFQLSRRIVGYLKDNGGRMNVTDSSSPEEIKSLFQCSKKDFKKALGLLYKKGRVSLSDDVVSLDAHGTGK